MSAVPARNGARPAQERRLSLTEAVRRRPILALGTPLLVIGLTVWFVLWVQPLFETTATIRIDEEKSGVAVLQALQTLSKGSEVNTEMAVLRSRSLMEDVTRTVGFQVRLSVPERTSRDSILTAVQADSLAPEASYVLQRVGDGRYSVSANVVKEADVMRPFSRPTTEVRSLPEAMVGVPIQLLGATATIRPGAGQPDQIVIDIVTFPDAVKEMSDNTVVTRPDREAAVVAVTYRGSDQRLTHAVPNELARAFIVKRQGSKSSEAVATKQFLADQLDTLQQQLALSEERLKSFRQSANMVAPEEEAGAHIQQLAEMQVDRNLKEVERSSLDSLMREVRNDAGRNPRLGPGGRVQSPYRRLMASPSLILAPAATQQIGTLNQLETELSTLLLGQTERNPEVVARLERIAAIEASVQETAETYLQGLTTQIEEADRQLAAFKDELAVIPAAQMTYVRLKREAELSAEMYGLLSSHLTEASIQASRVDESVRVVDSAPFPREPVRPKPLLSLFMALMSGSILGLAAALAAEHRDRSVRDRSDVGRVTGSPVLGLIPHLRTAGLGNGTRFSMPWVTRGSRPRLVHQIEAGNPAAEAYRGLRTNLLFSRIDHPPRVLTFTSPMPGDGKSTTAMNLALVLAQSGHRVLLVDADMRRGLLNEVLSTAREPGLSEVLFGRSSFAAAVKPMVPVEGIALDFLPSGIWPPNPAELIASGRMAQLITEVRATYEMVILDAPPLNLVTDAALLGTHCDGVILVARAGVTEEASLEYAVEQLEKVRAPLLGTVLNGVDEARQDYYGSRGKQAHTYFNRS
jgi:capsular exopolysaccharide synthesis family protein